MKIVLDVHTPFIRGYLHHAYPLSIFPENDVRLKNWALSNYLQLYYNVDPLEHDNKVNFYLPYNCICDYSKHPLVITKMFQKQMLDEDIIAFIEKSIQLGHYVYTYVDEYCLSYARIYQKSHYIHDIFINGFDSVTKELNVTSYDKSGKYKSLLISYTEFVDAYSATLSLPPDKRYHFHDDFYLLKANPTCRYNFKMDLVIILLSDYLHSRNTSLSYGMIANSQNYVFGMDIYNVLYDLLENETFIDMRAFHIFWEHKMCIVKTIEYIIELYGSPIESNLLQFRKIEKDALTIRDLLVRYCITKEKRLLTLIKTMLEELFVEEKAALNHLITNLNRIIE